MTDSDRRHSALGFILQTRNTLKLFRMMILIIFSNLTFRTFAVRLLNTVCWKKHLTLVCVFLQVNGKPYPLAKIQLGRMGALHPANRLAAYLTGRVGLNRKKQGSSSSSSVIKPPQIQTSAPTTQPSVTLLKIPIAPSGTHSPLLTSSICHSVHTQLHRD